MTKLEQVRINLWRLVDRNKQALELSEALLKLANCVEDPTTELVTLNRRTLKERLAYQEGLLTGVRSAPGTEELIKSEIAATKAEMAEKEQTCI